jgi:hypothetical protein
MFDPLRLVADTALVAHAPQDTIEQQGPHLHCGPVRIPNDFPRIVWYKTEHSRLSPLGYYG